ncbi:hypothetical protein DDI_4377 [Dickeya dianthicola RNS04.9]|nr:hypothetical protein DDI_4377 [Dickeya dianthicola RNS04.9]
MLLSGCTRTIFLCNYLFKKHLLQKYLFKKIVVPKIFVAPLAQTQKPVFCVVGLAPAYTHSPIHPFTHSAIQPNR